MKENKGYMDMRGFPMPKEHKEISMDNLDCCELKYVNGEFANPKDLYESDDKLSKFVRNNQMKY